MTGVDAAPKQRILAEPLPHVDVSTPPSVSGSDDQDENPVGDEHGRGDPQAAVDETEPARLLRTGGVGWREGVQEQENPPGDEDR